GDDLDRRLVQRACEIAWSGRPERIVVPGAPCLGGTGGYRDEGKDAEDREDRDESRIGDHPRIAKSTGTRAEGTCAGHDPRKEKTHGQIHEPEEAPAVDDTCERM